MDSIFEFERSDDVEIFQGDCRTILPTLEANAYHSCITSPPYFNQRDYRIDGQFGLEDTPQAYIDGLVAIFREVRRVLRNDGTLWLNLGDGYANQSYADNGIKARDLIGMPWRIAFALQADGWYLRQDIIWQKPDTMPEPAKNRCVKAHEYIFLFAKQADYYFDFEAIRERGVSGRKGVNPQRNTKETHGIQSGGNTGINAAKVKMLEEYERNGFVMRNKRSVWTVSVQQGGVRNLHFATFPPPLIEPCILAGAPPGGLVLDPFGGSGTTGLTARKLGRRAHLIELNPTYAALAEQRTQF